MNQNNFIIDSNTHIVIFFGRLNNPASSKFNEWEKNNLDRGIKKEIINIKYAQSENFEHSIMIIYKDINNDVNNENTES